MNIPPYRIVRAEIRKANPRYPDQPTVVIKTELLDYLINCAVQLSAFDEAHYLKKYPDVAAAVQAGTVASAKDHFVQEGYREGRHPVQVKVDEAWYLEKNQDVDTAVQKGAVKSATQHYVSAGWKELRSPDPQSEGALDRWINILRL